MSEFRMETMADVLKLTPEQFGRFVPDFVAWYALCKETPAGLTPMACWTWLDDNKSGEIHSVAIYHNDEVIATVRGGAYS